MMSTATMALGVCWNYLRKSVVNAWSPGPKWSPTCAPKGYRQKIKSSQRGGFVQSEPVLFNRLKPSQGGGGMPSMKLPCLCSYEVRWPHLWRCLTHAFVCSTVTLIIRGTFLIETYLFHDFVTLPWRAFSCNYSPAVPKGPFFKQVLKYIKHSALQVQTCLWEIKYSVCSPFT